MRVEPQRGWAQAQAQKLNEAEVLIADYMMLLVSRTSFENAVFTREVAKLTVIQPNTISACTRHYPGQRATDYMIKGPRLWRQWHEHP